MKKQFLFVAAMATLSVGIVGCGGGTKPGAAGASAEGAKYLTGSPAANEKSVDEARANAQDNEAVVLVGRIGGSETPFVDGLAAFEIVDMARKSCSDIPGDSCKTPWDFCCEVDLHKSKALIQIVDAQGLPVKKGAKELLGVKELDTVVVQGKAKRDKTNLTILAEKIYIRPSTTK